MVVRRIFALPTRFILGQEPSCGLSFSPTRPARSGACRIPVKNTLRPAQLRFCLHTPLSLCACPLRFLFSRSFQIQGRTSHFQAKSFPEGCPRLLRQAGQNLPWVLEGILQAKSAQATTPITDCLWFRRFDIHDSFLPHHLHRCLQYVPGIHELPRTDAHINVLPPLWGSCLLRSGAPLESKAVTLRFHPTYPAMLSRNRIRVKERDGKSETGKGRESQSYQGKQRTSMRRPPRRGRALSSSTRTVARGSSGGFLYA